MGTKSELGGNRLNCIDSVATGVGCGCVVNMGALVEERGKSVLVATTGAKVDVAGAILKVIILVLDGCKVV